MANVRGCNPRYAGSIPACVFMKVRDLIQNCNPEDEVVLSVDAEDNRFDYCRGVSPNMRYEDGQVGYAALSDFPNGDLAVVLWP